MKHIVHPMARADSSVYCAMGSLAVGLIVFPIAHVVGVVSKNNKAETFSFSLLIQWACVQISALNLDFIVNSVS
jgi:hypothetical protein